MSRLPPPTRQGSFEISLSPTQLPRARTDLVFIKGKPIFCLIPLEEAGDSGCNHLPIPDMAELAVALRQVAQDGNAT